MAAQLANPVFQATSRRANRSRDRKVLAKSSARSKPFKNNSVDKAFIAGKLELIEQKRELMYSVSSLVMKIGLVIILSSSFVNVGISSHKRIRRQIELAKVLSFENQKLEKLMLRFD